MASSNNKSEYRSIFKATSTLGSVQLFNILIGIVRNKVVSLLLGPAGMGIVGLFTSTTSTITGFTNCGLTISAVKNVAVAYEKKDLDILGKVVYTVKKLLWITGLFATAICIVLSKQLSIWSFGNDDFALSFCCLSISLLFTQLTSGNQMIIKACRQIKMYAKANVLGNFLSLFITVPLYFVWGVDAIVPVLVLLSLSTFACSYYYQRKLLIREVRPETLEFKNISWDIFKIGIAIAAAELFPVCSSYYIRIFISNEGGLSDVGLFSAGFAILNGYVGMIFTAMSSDFVPRLSAIVDDNKACQATINNQIRIAALILLPLLSLLIVFSKLIVLTLYSSEFVPIVGMIMWGAVGMYLRSSDWAMGCLFVPKRETKAYFILSIVSLILYLSLNVSCYLLWGITGFGVALLLNHFISVIIDYIYMKWKFNVIYEYDVVCYNLMGIVFFITLICLNNNSFNISQIYTYILDGIALVSVSLFCLYKLNMYMDLKSFIMSKIKK